MRSREVIKMLEEDGWQPKKEVQSGTLRSIKRQAGL